MGHWLLYGLWGFVGCFWAVVVATVLATRAGWKVPTLPIHRARSQRIARLVLTVLPTAVVVVSVALVIHAVGWNEREYGTTIGSVLVGVLSLVVLMKLVFVVAERLQREETRDQRAEWHDDATPVRR